MNSQASLSGGQGVHCELHLRGIVLFIVVALGMYGPPSRGMDFQERKHAGKPSLIQRAIEVLVHMYGAYFRSLEVDCNRQCRAHHC